MAPPTDELRARILDDHNERLRDLEGHYAEVSSTISAQTVKIDQLGVAVEDGRLAMQNGMEALGQKLEECIKPVSEQLGVVKTRIEDHSTQLAELQKVEKERSKTKRSREQKIKTVILAVFVAAAGAIGTHIVESTWSHFTPPTAAQAAQSK